MTAIFISICSIAFMIALGYVGEKTGYVTDIKQRTGRVVTHITLPLLVVSSVTKNEITPQRLTVLLVIMGLALAAVVIMMLAGALTARLFRLEGGVKTVHTCLSGFGNVVFMAFPLISAVFGDEGLMYAVFYYIVNDFLLYTLGLLVIQGKVESKKLLNPNTIAILISVVMLAFGIRLPAFLQDTFSTMGAATTPLSMLFIGSSLAQIRIGSVFKRGSIWLLTVLKMVVFPILFIFLLAPLPLDFTVKAVVILQIAMPVQSILAILAEDYGGDSAYCSECVFISTLFGMVSLPLVYYILQIVFT